MPEKKSAPIHHGSIALRYQTVNQSIQKKYVTIRDILLCYEHLLWYANFCLTINKCFSSSTHDIVLKMSLKIIQKINAGHLLGKKMNKTLFDISYSKKGFSIPSPLYVHAWEIFFSWPEYCACPDAGRTIYDILCYDRHRTRRNQSLDVDGCG